jgi:hypothetical protein
VQDSFTKRQGRLKQSYRPSLLNDGIERLLNEARIAANFSAAADLEALLEKWRIRDTTRDVLRNLS